MPIPNSKAETISENWQEAIPLVKLRLDSAKMLRIDGKQIAFFNTDAGVKACDNRCPHEGFPLSEGSLSGQCTLTCNWHNWKFDLDSGDNLNGGDRLRTYPVELRDGVIWVNLAELPFAQRYQSIRQSLHDAFDDYSYDRSAREIARLGQLGADPLDALRFAIDWSWQRMEFGWTHAYAGMADWLTLYDERKDDPESQLICLVESFTHVADDVLREREFTFSNETKRFDEAIFLEAIEAENEKLTTAMIRGGVRDGLLFDDFESALTQAALQHYNDFGHSIIYLTKAKQLIQRLGHQVLEPLLLSLVRSFIFAPREDKIPEFRKYQSCLKKWGRSGGQEPQPSLWRRKSINQSLQATVSCSDSPSEKHYQALLVANAINLLSFDRTQEDKIQVSVSGNVGWLDFTHGLTFASAVREQCTRFPALWPQGLLQMACFNGRNAGFTEADYKLEETAAIEVEDQIGDLIERVLDHGQNEHIVSVHLLKTVLAVRAEISSLEAAEAALLVAAVSRFFNSPIKRRQARRTAYQSLQFVARE